MNAVICCQTCGHKPSTRRLKIDSTITLTTTATLTTDQLHAHYKATAPGLDLLFTMAHCSGITLSADWVDEAQALCRQTWPDGRLRNITRKEFYRRLGNLQDDWRHAHNVAELAARTADTLAEVA